VLGYREVAADQFCAYPLPLGVLCGKPGIAVLERHEMGIFTMLCPGR
jgi:hypothetical protein